MPGTGPVESGAGSSVDVVTLAVSHLGHQVLAGRRQLVEPAGAVHDERVLGAELREHLRDRHDQRLRVDAHHLPARAGRDW